MISKTNELLNEGLFVNTPRKTVKLTLDNPNGIDFSESSYIKYKAKGITVYSIFKHTPLPDRTLDKDIDGNPFIFALKEIDGWHFDISDEEIYFYLKRFLTICRSIKEHYDVIVMTPSKHIINVRFMDVIYNIVGADIKLTDYFFKIKTETAYFNFNTELIEKTYKNESSREYVENQMLQAFKRMGTYFEVKKFPKEYLKFIDTVIDLNLNYSLDDSLELFQNKKVLVLDDIFSTGKTVSDCVKVIREFEPQQVDAITLLSRKFHY